MSSTTPRRPIEVAKSLQLVANGMTPAAAAKEAGITFSTVYRALQRLRGGTSLHLPLAERLFNKVTKTPTCWLWTGTVNNMGYGLIGATRNPRRNSLVHRASWEIANGPVPDGMCVLHKCDTPRCINPEHLFLGTRKDNAEDCVSKDRQARGDRNGHAKLTDAQALEIRAKATGKRGNIQKIAKQYNVSAAVVRDILKRITYRHI